MIQSVNLKDSALQFESEKPSEQTLYRFMEGFKICLHTLPVSPRNEAYPIFSAALKITRIVAKLENLKKPWIDFLSKETFKINRPDKSVHSYDFHALMKLALSGEDNFKIEIAVVDSRKDDLVTISKGIERIAMESIGLSQDAKLFEEILKEPNTICLLAMHEDAIIGCLYGTCVKIDGSEGQPINVLHFRFLGRKADYPAIDLIKLLQSHEKKFYDKFHNLDYVSLCVMEGNIHARERYEEFGFSDPEPIEEKFMENTIVFLKKKLGSCNDLVGPIGAEVRAAVKNNRAKRCLS